MWSSGILKRNRGHRAVQHFTKGEASGLCNALKETGDAGCDTKQQITWFAALRAVRLNDGEGSRETGEERGGLLSAALSLPASVDPSSSDMRVPPLPTHTHTHHPVLL